MFTIRRETAHALKILKLLSKNENKILSLNEISKKTKVSFLFLQKIARKLRLAKMISSVYGVDGGYALAIDAKKLSVLKVIEAMEGKCDVFEFKENKKLVETNKKIVKLLENVKLINI
ncbi:MAG: Transcriptional regulator, BadM/Rrf2 family [uncultured bacterium]|nr:MAG: Transcriptional regulator, BadM/Rrf2 family [uncultured bacterium]